MRVLILLTALLLASCAHAFMVGGKAPLPQQPISSRLQSRHRQEALTMVDKKLVSSMLRRDLLLASAVGVVTLAGGIPLIPKAALVKPAVAAEGEVGDLDAPTPEELEAERVKAKLRRQKEAVLSKEKGGAEEASYGESLKRERERQRSMKKDKKQRREDLCEKLGRGC